MCGRSLPQENLVSRKSFPPRVRNKPTPGERETSLITPGFGIEFRLPLRVLVFRAIPRGFRSGKPATNTRWCIHEARYQKLEHAFSMSWFRFRNRVCAFKERSDRSRGSIFSFFSFSPSFFQFASSNQLYILSGT